MIRLLGYVMRREVGRPLAVYGWHAVKQDNLLHEVELTRAFQAIVRRRPHSALRLDDVDPRLKPDMELWLTDSQEHFYVEFDRSTIPHRVQAERWDLYQSVNDRGHELLIIATSEARMNTLMLHASPVAHIARFTLLETLLQNPTGEIWIDCSGDRHRI